MNIGWAMQHVRDGRSVRRKAWRANVSIVLVRQRAATPTSRAPDPVLEVYDDGRRLPIVLSTPDLLATDWTFA